MHHKSLFRLSGDRPRRRPEHFVIVLLLVNEQIGLSGLLCKPPLKSFLAVTSALVTTAALYSNQSPSNHGMSHDEGENRRV